MATKYKQYKDIVEVIRLMDLIKIGLVPGEKTFCVQGKVTEKIYYIGRKCEDEVIKIEYHLAELQTIVARAKRNKKNEKSCNAAGGK